MGVAANKVAANSFGVASSTNHVNMTDFINQVISPRLFKRTSAKTVFGGLVNKDYEGEIKGKGDTVKIFDIAPIQAKTYAVGTAATPGTGAITMPATRGTTAAGRSGIEYQVLSGNSMTITVTEADYYGFEVEDVEQFMSNPKYVNRAVERSAEALAKATDRWLYSAMLTQAKLTVANNFGLKGGTGATAIAAVAAYNSAADTVYPKLVEVGTRMDDNLVPEDGRWITLPSFAKGLLLQDSRFVGAAAAGQAEARDKGYIGDIAGFKIYILGRPQLLEYAYDATAMATVTINPATGEAWEAYRANDAAAVLVDKDAGGTAVYNTYSTLAGHNDAFTFADVLTKNEQIRLESSFADAWRGLHVYGGGSTRPNWLFEVTSVDNTATLLEAEA